LDGAPIRDRHDADRHQSAAPRRIQLSDRAVIDPGVAQLRLDETQVRFIAGRQRDGAGVGRQSVKRAVAGSMDELRSKRAALEVLSNDAVVRQWVRLTGFEPAAPELLGLRAPPLGQARGMLVFRRPSDGVVRRPPGSFAVPLSPGGASEAVKLARASRSEVAPRSRRVKAREHARVALRRIGDVLGL
jgi:hypothetical protein